MTQEPKSSFRRHYSSDVHILDVDGREFVLVGTAHISRESVDLVREVIEKEQPDCVCVELDSARYLALSQKQHWESLDLRQVIRQKQLATLLVNMVLASYQKRLGGKLGVMPGSELLEAVRTAEQHEIPIALCDREIRATLRRAWKALSLWKKFLFLSSLLASLFERPEITEEDLRALRERDALSELMRELGDAMPALKRVLIDERDSYLAQRIRECAGDTIVAVVGAGHVEGMRRALLAGDEVDLEELGRIPAASAVWKWFGWGIPALILGSLAYIGWSQGAAAAGSNALFWFLANALPSGLGGVLALGHPVTVAAAFFSAPFTSLTPVIGAGYVSAFVQTFVRPPFVREFRSVGEDIVSLSGWWRNRLLRIFLVFVLTTLGSMIGTWVGGVEIVSNLF
ncbi:MAG: TraB/GumN family protein [Myxococcota bacterium]